LITISRMAITNYGDGSKLKKEIQMLKRRANKIKTISVMNRHTINHNVRAENTEEWGRGHYLETGL